MKSLLPISVFVLLLIYSCTNPNVEGDGRLGLIKYDSIAITADSISLSFYKTFTINRDEGIYIGYNPQVHSLDLFSLENSTFLERIVLNPAGPSAILPVKSLFCHNPDSTFLFCLSQLILLDSAYQIRNKYSPFRAKGFIENEIGQISASAFGKLLFHSPTQTILLSSNLFEDKVTKPILAAYDLQLDSIYHLPLFYPQEDFMKGGYGLLKQANYSSFNDTALYYGFAFTPEIFIYDFRKGFSKSFSPGLKIVSKAKHLKTKDPVFNMMNDHAIQNPMYFEPLVTSSHIVQIFQQGQNLTSTNGEFNNFKDKDWNLLIYSSDGSFLENVTLNIKPYFRNSWFVYKDEIYLCPHPLRFNGRPYDMTSLIFHRIKIQ